MPTMQEKALQLILFYQNRQSSVAVVEEFRCIKQIRRGPVSPCALRKVIQKFETIGKLGTLPGGRRKKIPSSSVKNVTTIAAETSSYYLHGNVSVP